MPWAKQGSTRRWRQVRAQVLRRDGYTCGRCGIETHDKCSLQGCPQCVQVHHVAGTHDLRHPGEASVWDLEAWCQRCNARVGDPTRPSSPLRERRLMSGVKPL